MEVKCKLWSFYKVAQFMYHTRRFGLTSAKKVLEEINLIIVGTSFIY